MFVSALIISTEGTRKIDFPSELYKIVNNIKQATNLYHISKQILIDLKPHRPRIINLLTPLHKLMLNPIRRKISILFLTLIHVTLSSHFNKILYNAIVDLVDNPDIIRYNIFLILWDDDWLKLELVLGGVH